MRRLLITLIALMGPGLAVADEGAARASLERFTEGLERFQAAFRQSVISSEGQLMDQGAGQVWMQRPDRFRWRYDGEFPELIVADGARVWIHDETLEQVTVREQSELPENSPLMLLTDLSGLDEQFVVVELGESEGLLLLGLSIDSLDAEFERVILGLRGDVLALMVLEDAFGMRTEIAFEQVQRNPELDAELFHFTPPPETDVIGEVEPETP